jgi:hypothetical protein
MQPEQRSPGFLIDGLFQQPVEMGHHIWLFRESLKYAVLNIHHQFGTTTIGI